MSVAVVSLQLRLTPPSRRSNVVAVDNRQEGLEVLKKAPKHLQPDETRLIDSDESKESVAKELGGAFHETNAGVDRVVICAEDKNLVLWSQKLLRKGGIIVDVGLVSADAPAPLSLLCACSPPNLAPLPPLQPADGPVRRPHVHSPSAHRADFSRVQFLVDSFALNFCEQQLRGRLICSPEEIESMLKLHADNSCETYVEKTYRVEQINDMVSLAPQTRPAHSADAQSQIEHYKSKSLMGRLVMDFQ